MELNTHNEHEHASLSMKVLLLIFAVILVGVMGYFVWNENRTISDDSTTVHPKATTSTTATDPTTDWKTFKSAVINLAFKYPPSSAFSESEPLLARVPQGLKTSGHQVYFADSSKGYPDFDATSSDFTADDSVPHDLVSGTLDSKTSFTISLLSGATSIITEVGNGMYKVTGYSNIECSPGVGSYLFVRPPTNSGLKYISFFLGSDNTEFAKSDLSTSDTCSPKAAAIAKRISDFDADPTVRALLAKAVGISNTFKIK